MFAKDDGDDENIPDFVVFPPLPLDISADYDGNILEVDNVNVDIVAFAPTPGCNGVLIDEFIDHPSDTGSTTDSMPASHSLPGFPEFPQLLQQNQLSPLCLLVLVLLRLLPCQLHLVLYPLLVQHLPHLTVWRQLQRENWEQRETSVPLLAVCCQLNKLGTRKVMMKFCMMMIMIFLLCYNFAFFDVGNSGSEFRYSSFRFQLQNIQK